MKTEGRGEGFFFLAFFWLMSKKVDKKKRERSLKENPDCYKNVFINNFKV